MQYLMEQIIHEANGTQSYHYKDGRDFWRTQAYDEWIKGLNPFLTQQENQSMKKYFAVYFKGLALTQSNFFDTEVEAKDWCARTTAAAKEGTAAYYEQKGLCQLPSPVVEWK